MKRCREGRANDPGQRYPPYIPASTSTLSLSLSRGRLGSATAKAPSVVAEKTCMQRRFPLQRSRCASRLPVIDALEGLPKKQRTASFVYVCVCVWTSYPLLLLLRRVRQPTFSRLVSKRSKIVLRHPRQRGRQTRGRSIVKEPERTSWASVILLILADGQYIWKFALLRFRFRFRFGSWELTHPRSCL